MRDELSELLAGVRKRVDAELARGILIHAFTIMFRLLTGFPGTDVTNGFRAYRLALLDDARVNVHQDWLDRRR